MQWITLGSRISLSGVQYSDYQQVDSKLRPGLTVNLVGHPNNPHDTRAIGVEYKGVHLGWIPKGSHEQSLAWQARTGGSKVVGIITAINRTNPTWAMITVEIKCSVRPVSKRKARIEFDKLYKYVEGALMDLPEF